jgi:hypothetical protein
VNLSELNSEDGNGDRENQGTRSGEILEETSGNIMKILTQMLQSLSGDLHREINFISSLIYLRIVYYLDT